MDQYIPVIDMGLSDPSCSLTKLEDERVTREICDALENVGFAYLKNHGIPQNMVDTMFQASKRFFQLSEDEKRVKIRGEEHFTGYTAPGMEQLDPSYHKLENRETYDIQLFQDHFPTGVPRFESIVRNFYGRCEKISITLMKYMAKGLGLPEGEFLKYHRKVMKEGNTSTMRLLHYPPVTKETSTRCGAHTDYGTITLLFQDQVGGLKVRHRNGEFIDANPIPGTIVINIGDITEMWTGGRFKATEHKVPIPTDEMRRKATRYSIALFIHPDKDVLVEPLVGDKVSYQPVNAFTHSIAKFNEAYKKQDISV